MDAAPNPVLDASSMREVAPGVTTNWSGQCACGCSCFDSASCHCLVDWDEDSLYPRLRTVGEVTTAPTLAQQHDDE